MTTELFMIRATLPDWLANDDSAVIYGGEPVWFTDRTAAERAAAAFNAFVQSGQFWVDSDDGHFLDPETREGPEYRVVRVTPEDFADGYGAGMVYAETWAEAMAYATRAQP